MEPETVIVVRHAGTIEYLRRRGFVPEDAQIIEHASGGDIMGKRVIGMLPYHMAALAESMTVVDLEVPQSLRGTELSVDEVEQYAVGISTYSVKQIGSYRGIHWTDESPSQP